MCGNSFLAVIKLSRFLPTLSTMHMHASILAHEKIAASETGLGVPLEYYLIRYHEGCLEGNAPPAVLLRGCLKSRAEVFRERWPGYYEADAFRPCEQNEDTYIAMLVDGRGEIVTGARAIFSKTSHSLPYYSNYPQQALDGALQQLSQAHGPLQLCEYGGAFTKPAYQGNRGLAKAASKRLYDFIKFKNPDLIFVDAFADLLPKYVDWGRGFNLQQMYLLPQSNDPLGMLTVQSPHAVHTLDFANACSKAGVAAIDVFSDVPSTRFMREVVMDKALDRQRRAEGVRCNSHALRTTEQRRTGTEFRYK